MNYLEKSTQKSVEGYGYTLSTLNVHEGYENYPFEMDVRYFDDWGDQEVTLDALEVYRHLKEYFKGTPHE